MYGIIVREIGFATKLWSCFFKHYVFQQIILVDVAFFLFFFSDQALKNYHCGPYTGTRCLPWKALMTKPHYNDK